MTPANILSRVRDQLVEVTAAFWSDAELYRYMSDAESEINNMVECYQSSTTTASVTATSAYTINSDALMVTHMTFDTVPLKQIDRRQRDTLDMPGYGGSPQTGDPTHWYRYDGKFYLWPVPARAATVGYDFIAQPAAITTASTVFSIPQQYHNPIQDYTLYRAFVKDQDQAKSEFYKREFMQGVMDSKMREQRRRWAGGFQKVKTDSNYSTYDGIV